MAARVWERAGSGKREDLQRGIDGYFLYLDCDAISWVGLPELASKNIGHPIKLEFHTRNIFSVTYLYLYYNIYTTIFIVYIKFKFNWVSFIYLATLFTCVHK